MEAMNPGAIGHTLTSHQQHPSSDYTSPDTDEDAYESTSFPSFAVLELRQWTGPRGMVAHYSRQKGSLVIPTSVSGSLVAQLLRGTCPH
jgi:hypothetical protein